MNSTTKCIHVRYFAVLQEERGLVSEDVITDASSAMDLYQELKVGHGLSLNLNNLRVAVNDRFVEWSEKLTNGDKIVFIPPVAGG